MNGQGFEFHLDWCSAVAAHRERRVLACEPARLAEAPLAGLRDCLAALAADGACRARFAAGQLVPPHARERLRTIARRHFDAGFAGRLTEPEAGRYYPRAMIAPALGCSRRELTPFLVTAVRNDELDIDLNHPLARFELTLSARQRPLEPPPAPVCRQAAALVAQLTANGPDMQAAAESAAPARLGAAAFAREDEQPDALFYRTPRLVAHLDAAASAEIGGIYARFLRPGIRVLDLMSSWMSHLRDAASGLRVWGLGMNARELAENPRLKGRVVCDLNRLAALPFADRAFDLVICTASVEYLVRPLAVFREVARVLAPGGVFINTFSNRCFPTKAIELWSRLHPFERIGLVLSLYRSGGLFEDLHSESLQGLPRPPGDKYAGRLSASDPVFAVWGRRSETLV